MTIKKQEFFAQLEEQLDLDPGTLDENASLQETWDSLGPLAFMALAQELCDVNVAADHVAECRTGADLMNLLGDRIAA